MTGGTVSSILARRVFHHTDAFVSEDRAGLHAWHGSPDHMQVSAANGAGGNSDDRIRWLLNGRLAYALQANIAHSMKNDGFHNYLRPKTRMHCVRIPRVRL